MRQTDVNYLEFHLSHEHLPKVSKLKLEEHLWNKVPSKNFKKVQDISFKLYAKSEKLPQTVETIKFHVLDEHEK